MVVAIDRLGKNTIDVLSTSEALKATDTGQILHSRFAAVSLIPMQDLPLLHKAEDPTVTLNHVRKEKRGQAHDGSRCLSLIHVLSPARKAKPDQRTDEGDGDQRGSRHQQESRRELPGTTGQQGKIKQSGKHQRPEKSHPEPA